MNNTLLKGLAVLELLSHSDRPLNLTQIASELGVVKSNVHRLMQALMETHYVIRHEEGGTYAASIKLWEMGSAVLSKLDLRLHAQPEMQVLLEKTGETVHLSVLDRGEAVYVHKLESPAPVRTYTQIGGRAPAYCVATGKAQLAYAGEAMLAETARHLKRFTSRTIVDPDQFLREMRKVRDQGFAMYRGEYHEGVWGVAAPIMDARGCVIAAVGISGPAERLRKRSMRDCGALVIAAASEISQRLGANPQVGALARLSWTGQIGREAVRRGRRSITK